MYKSEGQPKDTTADTTFDSVDPETTISLKEAQSLGIRAVGGFTYIYDPKETYESD